MVDNLYQSQCAREDITSPFKDIRVKNTLIRSLFGAQGFAKPHIDSFDEFVNYRMKEIITAKLNKRIECEAVPGFWLQFNDIRVAKPTHQRSYDKYRRHCQLYPHEARTSNLSYSADIFVDIQYGINDAVERRQNVKIGRLPIMLGSSRCHLSGRTEKELAYLKECPYDPRGYFIVCGTEKVLLIQEQMIENRILVQKNSKGEIAAWVISYTLDTKTMCEMVMKNGKLYVRSGSFAEPIPVFIMLKALGMDNDQEVFQGARAGSFPTHLQLTLDECLVLSLQESFARGVRTESEAVRHLSTKLWNRMENKKTRNPQKEVRDKLCSIFLAHIKVTEANKLAKAHYLILMLRKLVQGIYNPSSLDNRDYYGNKRMKSAGTLLQLLFQDRFKVFCAQLKQQLTRMLLKSKQHFQIAHFLERRCDVITSGIQQAIATGNWVIKRFHIDRKGVSQQLSRISYIAAIGMITRLNSQFEKTRKVAGPRALLGSHWGMICPCDTPDGQGCGLIKNLALTACLSTSCRQFKPNNLGILEAQLTHGRGHRVLLDGTILGYTYSHSLVHRIRLLRRKGLIEKFVNVALLKRKGQEYGEIIINTDSGRLVRPLFVVTEGTILLTSDMVDAIRDKSLTFNDLLSKGVVQFLDVNEEDNALIATTAQQLTPAHTHLQIDPYTIIGVVAGIIPYPHHNQSPRNLFQCSMGKQSQGISGHSALVRDDTVSYVLAYPQRPLVSTAHIQLTNYDKLPAGENASVAVMSYSGYDIEDAIIVNSASLDRAFQRSFYYRKHQVEFKNYQNTGLKDFLVGKTDELQGNDNTPSPFYLKKYDCLDEDGLGKVGHPLKSGSIFVNKKVPMVSVTDDPHTRTATNEPSVFKSHSGNTFIERVIVTANEQRPLIVKTITREMRRPELGDKLSSRHGQKGVCGLIVKEEDMPFSETGWRPDLIMNPHGYPSRMTVGKLLQLIGGKAGCLKGRIMDGTAFAGIPFNTLRAILIDHGFSEDGKDVLISGTSGQYLPCYVFSGPIFYQRLKHMVADKIHARSLGKVTMLTRQPTEGRSREGGLRLGEMERDCLLGYGASDLLLERLLYSSDDATVLVCAKCGFFKHSGVCEQCKTKKVYSIKMPYACKLLFQELISMGIRPKINVARISSNPFAEHERAYT